MHDITRKQTSTEDGETIIRFGDICKIIIGDIECAELDKLYHS